MLFECVQYPKRSSRISSSSFRKINQFTEQSGQTEVSEEIRIQFKCRFIAEFVSRQEENQLSSGLLTAEVLIVDWIEIKNKMKFQHRDKVNNR